MTRILGFLAITFLWCAPVHAEKISLSELSSYLNKLQTATGGFTQINGDGTISNGTIFIRRPGRMRFEYDPPEKTLVLASAGKVAIFDGKSSNNPETYPLKRTPLNIILERNVDLGQARMVVAHTADDKTTTVTAQDPNNPEYGNIQLVFTANPTELRQWVVTDGSGNETTVILRELTKGGSIANSKFSIVREAENWN